MLRRAIYQVLMLEREYTAPHWRTELDTLLEKYQVPLAEVLLGC